MTAVAVLAVSLETAPARAQQVPVAADPPAEGGLVAQQLLVGGLASIFAAAGTTALAFSDKREGYEIGAGLMATAFLPGLAVCALGTSSRGYEGSCAASIAGAYSGVLLSGLVGRQFRPEDRDPSPGQILLVWGISAVATSAAAVIGWHATKHRKPAPAAAPVAPSAPSAFWPAMPVRRLAPPPGTVSVPVLAFAF